jgi:hypothetical protein
MGMSRRQFTKEFKLAAVRRLEEGVSLGEVARGLEVNTTCCTAGGVSFGKDQATRFPVMDNGAGPRAGSPSWNGRSANRRWRSIF